MPRKKLKDKTIPLLLLEDIVGLGNRGEIKKVKSGYALFLVRKKKGIILTKENLSKVENLRKLSEINIERKKKDIENLKEKIASLTFSTKIKIGPHGEVYNSVSKIDIKDFLKKQGIFVDKNDIELEAPIKEIGEFRVNIKLGLGEKAELKLIIEPEKENVRL